MPKKTDQPDKRRLRILFNTNAPWSTSGYGTQAREILPLMVESGFSVGCVCFFGLEGGVIELNGITCYPKIADQWGSDAVVEHSKAFKPDVVFTLQDIWVLNPAMLRQFNHWIPIVPIDHEPTPPAVSERLKSAYRIVSYSPFGERQLRSEGFHSTMIPHTVDTQTFQPLDVKERKTIRKQMGIPEDIFLFGMVAANKDNPSRKSFQQVMDAFVLFKRNHPKSGIYFHTLLQQDKGFPIQTYAQFLGIEKDIFYPPPYDLLFKIDRPTLSKVYNAMDCLVMPSTNEGFGVPAIEAQACGVPVIANNYTAMRDLVKPGAVFLVDGWYKLFSPLASYTMVPNVDSIHKAMERMYSSNREQMGQVARSFVVENYDTQTVFREKWLPFLEQLEKELITQ
jgi:glycosyltransferase involved in cell wall biosynthesis